MESAISRVLSRAIIHLGLASPQASSDLPGSCAGHANTPLFGLAPGGVYHATRVTTRAVRSYRTLSPLPADQNLLRRSTLCCTGRRLTPPRCYLAPCPVEPGLSSPCASKHTGGDYPADSAQNHTIPVNLPHQFNGMFSPHFSPPFVAICTWM